MLYNKHLHKLRQKLKLYFLLSSYINFTPLFLCISSSLLPLFLPLHILLALTYSSYTTVSKIKYKLLEMKCFFFIWRIRSGFHFRMRLVSCRHGYGWVIRQIRTSLLNRIEKWMQQIISCRVNTIKEDKRLSWIF